MSAPVTIADVARLAGVSTVTVSRTLNNTGRISDETRARVIQAARDLGYVANPAARRLRGARTNLVGMVIPELVSPSLAEVARAAAVLISHFGVPTDLPNVRADSYHGARAATTHLLDLGHRRVGFIAGAAESSQAHERLRA